MGKGCWPWTMLQLIDGEIVRTKVQPYLEPPARCGTLTHDNVDTALLRGLRWSGEITFTPSGITIIEAEKPESTNRKAKD